MCDVDFSHQLDRMKEKRVRFKDPETEINDPATCRFDVGSAPCEAWEDLPQPTAPSNGPKTSEFAFFKRLKQDVGHTSCQNPLKRDNIQVRNFRRSNHAIDLGNSKLKDVKSLQHVRKSTTNEYGSFYSPRDATLEDSAIRCKRDDNGISKYSSVFQTPTTINVDSFHSTTANASVNLEIQQQDVDIFSSKRLKLLQQIAKTFFPESVEIPRECDLVFLLLSRVLPENSEKTSSQTLRQRLPKTKEKCELYVDSNFQSETTDTYRKLVKADEDHILDNSASSAQINDASAATCSDWMLLGLEGNEQGRSLDGTASWWLSRYGDASLLALGDELHDYTTPGSTDILKNQTYKQFLYDAYDNSRSCNLGDQFLSYEVLNRSYNPSTAFKSCSLLHEDDIHNYSFDRRVQLSSNSWYDSHPQVSYERFRPSALTTLRDYSEHDYLNDTEVTRAPTPLLLGWDCNELDMHDSTHKSHMELELYCPSSSGIDHPDGLELQVHCPSSSQSDNHWDSLENSALSRLVPYTNQDHGFQRYSHCYGQEKDLVPRSPCVPFLLTYGPEQSNPVDIDLFKNISRGSNFFFIQKGSQSMEDMMRERKCKAVEAFLISQDFESDCGFLKDQYSMCTDNVLELFRQGTSSLQLLIANKNNLAISQPEDLSLVNAHVPIDQDDSFPLLREAEVEGYRSLDL